MRNRIVCELYLNKAFIKCDFNLYCFECSVKLFFEANDKSWEYVLRIAKKFYLKPCFSFTVSY